MDYAQFLQLKSQAGADSGFAPMWLPDFLFDFQASLCDWSIRKGRSELLADCGLGKTPMGLVWASNVARKRGKPVLYLTPNAVGPQTVLEAEKFGVQARLCRDGQLRPGDHIVVANYERLHYFSPHDFSAVVCDEASIVKNFAGERRGQITQFMRKVEFRLMQTATAAPNDYIELGTASEALGYLGYMDMLNRFFRNDMSNSATGRNHGNTMKWRLKGHAEAPFWRWVCSWARAIRRPSDLGFSDAGFVLPPLREVEHLVDAQSLPNGLLFPLPAADLREQREERRRTVQERCQKVAELVNHTGKPALVWCHLNEEGNELQRLIPDAVQVAGSDSDDAKEERLTAFARNQVRVLITKPKIGAWGLNLQHCNHVVYFPSHSFEQYYQAVRRCWRFGQINPVLVDIVATEGERGVMQNLQRKALQADAMFSRLVQEMNQAMGIERKTEATNRIEVPEWLCSISL